MYRLHEATCLTCQEPTTRRRGEESEGQAQKEATAQDEGKRFVEPHGLQQRSTKDREALRHSYPLDGYYFNKCAFHEGVNCMPFTGIWFYHARAQKKASFITPAHDSWPTSPSTSHSSARAGSSSATHGSGTPTTRPSTQSPPSSSSVPA